MSKGVFVKIITNDFIFISYNFIFKCFLLLKANYVTIKILSTSLF